MSRAAGLAITAVVTVLAGWAGWLVGTNDIPDPLPVGDRVQAAVDALQDSHVYVAPDSADLLSGTELARIEAAAAAASPETFIVVWEYTSEGGFYLESEGLRQIGTELGRPGYYVAVGRGGVTSEDVGIAGGYAYADDFEQDQEVDQESVVAKITEIIAESDGREFSEKATTGSAYWGGTGGTIAAGLLIGALVGASLVLVVATLWFIARSRRSRP